MSRLKPIIQIHLLAKTEAGLRPTHLSLFLALFWTWHQNGYQEYFTVYRSDLMNLGKIKSIATYHKCMKDLSVLGYIEYRPAFDYYKGSQVRLIQK
jgi:hypothetical protein